MLPQGAASSKRKTWAAHRAPRDEEEEEEVEEDYDDDFADESEIEEIGEPSPVFLRQVDQPRVAAPVGLAVPRKKAAADFSLLDRSPSRGEEFSRTDSRGEDYGAPKREDYSAPPAAFLAARANSEANRQREEETPVVDEALLLTTRLRELRPAQQRCLEGLVSALLEQNGGKSETMDDATALKQCLEALKKQKKKVATSQELKKEELRKGRTVTVRIFAGWGS